MPDETPTADDGAGGDESPIAIQPIEIQEEMERSFLDYAMSVITARALPDARDGLKPVQRRILYGMYAEGMRPDRPHRKCANAVGEVMGIGNDFGIAFAKAQSASGYELPTRGTAPASSSSCRRSASPSSSRALSGPLPVLPTRTFAPSVTPSTTPW